jgi:hypothetical protein
MTTTTSTGARGVAAHHHEWLALVEVSGPFVTLPVLKRALPQGLEPTDADLARQLRLAYQEWHDDSALHHNWVRWVLSDVLDFDDAMLAEGPALPPQVIQRVGEHGVTLHPDLAVVDPRDATPRLLVRILPAGSALDDHVDDDRWAASPLDRMVELCRHAGVRLGLVTNGASWTLIDAPVGGPSAFATWEASVWLDERLSLDAFRTLLGARRFFNVAEGATLEALLAESAEAEHEVTDQLGYQVRQAVELLVDAFGRADRNAGGQLLAGIPAEQIYEAAVTVLMRIVFLLAAEERDLLPLTDPVYQQAYAVSTLRGQLQAHVDQAGEEPLERHTSAWQRLLATFRMVHAGVAHENMRLPAYGGSLFDPDRFPFLEGRRPGESWRDSPGRPLPIDDRTVLAILHAVQVLEFRRGRRVEEARRLSFRALDVEQIGHVYEGLLDHTAYHAHSPVLGLAGKNEAELAAEDVTGYDPQADRDELVDWLTEQTGLTKRKAEKGLDTDLDAHQRDLLRAACDHDEQLAAELEPYAGLLRHDLRGLPQVWLPGSVYVTSGTQRSATGTYYTPRVLAEEMVTHALEPLCYQPGPADGADPEQWQLRPAGELLDLRVCDMAMGSGAFLVAACRYLADRVIDAWQAADDVTDGEITIFGEPATDAPDAEVVPADGDDRRLLARRVVVDRCLFGVDKNPMAVEMAKLSLWLITLANDRPFNFLDHALRCGDSLLGITDLGQLQHLHPDPDRGRTLHEGSLFDYHATWAPLVKDAIEKRRRLESFTVVTVADADQKARLHREANETLDALRVIGDVVVGAAIASASHGADMLDGRLADTAEDVATALDPDVADADRAVRLEDLRNQAAFWLDTDRPPTALPRETLHWALDFPEIFLDRPQPGFDAIIGNPPFLGGKRISGPLGSAYREYLVEHIAEGARGNTDLAAFFFLRGVANLREGGNLGLLATNTIGQGDTREVGLDRLTAGPATIYRAWRSRPWPGQANLEIAQVWLHRGHWTGQSILDGQPVPGITPSLDGQSRVSGPAHRLAANFDQSFIGSLLNGIGFVLAPEAAQGLIDKDFRNNEILFPYLHGQDLNSQPNQLPSRWVINFHDWTLEQAEEYPDALAVVRERVKPHRDALPGYKRRVRDNWWRYEHLAPALYEAIDGFDRVLAVARTSNTVAPAFIPANWVYSENVVLFAYEDDAHFGFLASALHWWWIVTHASSMRTDVRYTPSDCFETLPKPDLTADVAACGRALDQHRQALMLDRQEGLTKTYNRVHDPDERAGDVVELRRLHVELDYAVAAAYGWGDLELAHDFWPTRQGTRFTVGEPARTEVLDRLLELNHERYAEEVRLGLHERKSRSGRRAPRGQLDFDAE